MDINDLTIVLANYGKTGCVWSQGSMDGDATGTGGHQRPDDRVGELRRYPGYAAGAPGIKAVPEPASLLLVAAGLVGLVAYA